MSLERQEALGTPLTEYDPFGQPIRATGPFAAISPFRYSTKYYDSEVGLSVLSDPLTKDFKGFK